MVKNHSKEMIEAIKIERERLAVEIERLMDRLAVLEETLAIYGVKNLRPSARKREMDRALLRPEEPIQPVAHNGYEDMTQSEAAFYYLADKSKPAHVDEIARALVDRGIKLRGNVVPVDKEDRIRRLKPSLVSTMLRDPDRFMKVGRNIFALAGLSDSQKSESGINEGGLNAVELG